MPYSYNIESAVHRQRPKHRTWPIRAATALFSIFSFFSFFSGFCSTSFVAQKTQISCDMSVAVSNSIHRNRMRMLCVCGTWMRNDRFSHRNQPFGRRNVTCILMEIPKSNAGKSGKRRRRRQRRQRWWRWGQKTYAQCPIDCNRKKNTYIYYEASISSLRTHTAVVGRRRHPCRCRRRQRWRWRQWTVVDPLTHTLTLIKEEKVTKNEDFFLFFVSVTLFGHLASTRRD